MTRKKLEVPSHQAQLGRVRRIAGQLKGIEGMIEERRYCPEIIAQIRAAAAALRSLESTVLETHFQHCVADAFSSKDAGEKKKKIREIMDLFSRM